MIALQEAKAKLLDTIWQPLASGYYVIKDDDIVERSYAWIFIPHFVSYNDQPVGGAGLVFVDKNTGKQTQFSSAYWIESATEKYEEANFIWGLELISALTSDDKLSLQLKAKLNLNYDELIKFKKGKVTIISSGSSKKIRALKSELDEINISTALILLWKEQ